MITKFHCDPLKEHNSTKGDNPDLKINMYQLFFDEESIYEISKLYLNNFCNGRTDAHTHGQADSNMPLQLFQSWGHKKLKILIELILYVAVNLLYFSHV